MSYNKYNTRHSGRFNTPGQFVPAGEQPFNQQSFTPAPQPPPLPQQPRQAQQQNLQNVPIQPLNAPDVEMKTEPGTEGNNEGGNGGGGGRPHWMKNKLGGVKKVSNKERRRRQNETLRKLLTPKNALMVLNEMMPNEQLATQFKVEAAGNQFYKPANQQSFCADLTLDGNVYKGYGENKLSARNAAAEKAIRDLIIKRMSKVFANDASNAANAGTENADSAEGDNANGESEAETLPMIQLASFALHKLFSEWEYEGVKVPQLKPTGQQGNSTSESMEIIAPPPPKPKPPMKRKELPPNAATLHPCMLLTYMRPGLEYRELAISGDKPQTMLFTMGVDVDGATYIGKASNKKEARRAAARAACAALFNVTFPDAPAPTPPLQQ
ncbi:double-stranded RNA-specific editase 1 isoform X2 [Cydia splendana]|uniref:double-stranded RNA-specific editase 1 isoform X2 n=1 Tax=Cydia splendana TaxID=1100963 RepID=UPI0028F4AC93